jgi:general nucleoside transport system ATP-binding protein
MMPATDTPAFAVHGIVKRFPGVLANDHVDLTLARGEIHALLGENGAGKSTLMQILYGFHALDAGEILIDGAPVRIPTPAAAIALGIGMVHQEFMLVPSFTVVENTVLGLNETRSPLLDLATAAERLQSLSDRYGLAIHPHARVEHLPIGVQQRVEILKLLYRDARLLILDEPTAVLTTPERDQLFTVLRRLRAEGHTVVIVTHKLREIIELADRVTIMRDGRAITTVNAADVSEAELARLMVGRDVDLAVTRTPAQPGKPILEVRKLFVKDTLARDKVLDVSFTIHAGEILGIAGVDGNGQSELAEALLHLRPIAAGHVFCEGCDVTHLTPAQHRAAGMAYVPADRRGVGSIVEMSIAENAMLGRHHATGRIFRRTRAELTQARNLIQRFDVRVASLATPAGKLSGGNLQKLILGREIVGHSESKSKPSSALIVEQPTRGLDVGAIASIWRELLRERAEGKALLLISAELEELINLAGRIAVMYEGRIVGVIDVASYASDISGLRATLGRMMTGATTAQGAFHEPA